LRQRASGSRHGNALGGDFDVRLDITSRPVHLNITTGTLDAKQRYAAFSPATDASGPTFSSAGVLLAVMTRLWCWQLVMFDDTRLSLFKRVLHCLN
jgi:hypothetical protein